MKQVGIKINVSRWFQIIHVLWQKCIAWNALSVQLKQFEIFRNPLMWPPPPSILVQVSWRPGVSSNSSTDDLMAAIIQNQIAFLMQLSRQFREQPLRQ